MGRYSHRAALILFFLLLSGLAPLAPACPTVSLDLSGSSTVQEDQGALSFTVRCDPAPADGDLYVTISCQHISTEAGDFTLDPGVVMIPQYQTSETGTVTITDD
ncbi:hypothetical protein HQ520_03585, partial [bacterium]|nr:hypothetical protein [bacterium]